jgi:hypothetical protein
MKRRQIHYLVFKLGGVAGAIRRIIRHWRGLFTSSQIREVLARQYPLLEPHTHQIQDTLDWLEKSRLIQFLFHDDAHKFYRRNACDLYRRAVVASGNGQPC